MKQDPVGASRYAYSPVSPEDAFRQLANGWADVQRSDFFELLVTRLARMLDADHVLIARIMPGHMAYTLAAWCNGELLEPMNYALAGTPCENVLGYDPCLYTDNVSSRFPRDRMLADLGVESYLGVPIITPEGEPIGLLAIMNNRPMEADSAPREVARIAAAQVGAELARRRAEEAVAESERRLHTLMSHLPGVAYQCRLDNDWTMDFVNDRAGDLTGYSRDDIMSHRVSFAALIHPDDQDTVFQKVERAVRKHQPFVVTYRLLHRSGQIRWIWERGQGVFDAQGELLRLEGFMLDITEQHQSRQLQEAVYQIASAVTARSGQAFFHGLIEHLAAALGADAAFIATLGSGQTDELAIKAMVLEGRSRGAVKALECSSFTRRVMEQGEYVIEQGADIAFPRFRSTGGTPGKATACVGRRLDNSRGEPLGMLAVLYHQPLEDPQLLLSVLRIFGAGAASEIERQRYDAHIQKLAYRDTITGLPNRVAFMEALESKAREGEMDRSGLSLVFLDLKRFKEVNDTRGTHVGDALLHAVGERFGQILLDGDFIARLGGNEFAVILSGVNRQGLGRVMERFQKQLHDPVPVPGGYCSIDAYVGGAAYPEDADSVEQLFQHASIALHHAKHRSSGRGVYSSEMADDLYRKEELHGRLLHALRSDGLLLNFQPQFDLRTGEITGAEVLCRWHDAEKGWISPGEFIPLAEERGLIHELSDWVLAESCRQLQAWFEAGLPLPGQLSVNLSAEQFEDESLSERILSLCGPVTPDRLTLELTESAFMRDPEAAINITRRLRDAGFRLAIDDFGTGYSSLSYLRHFHVDTLKIDMSFVRDMLDDQQDHAIVETIIGMARTLDMKTVAEGVETLEHEAALRQLGCDQSQGFYYGRPLDADGFAHQWLEPNR